MPAPEMTLKEALPQPSARMKSVPEPTYVQLVVPPAVVISRIQYQWAPRTVDIAL